LGNTGITVIHTLRPELWNSRIPEFQVPGVHGTQTNNFTITGTTSTRSEVQYVYSNKIISMEINDMEDLSNTLESHETLYKGLEPFILSSLIL
jgi:hypothetical protein